MKKDEIYALLDENKIKYEVTNHKAVYNMDDLSGVSLPYQSQIAKNLFVRDDKKRQYYLISVKDDKRVDLKWFKNAYNTRPLSLASSDDLLEIMKLTPGSVTPFGLLNDTLNKVIFYLDKDFDNQIIGCHPNDNTATVWLNTSDLISIIEKSGNEIHLVDIGEVK